MSREYDYNKTPVLDPFRDGVKQYGDRVMLMKRTDPGWVDLSWNQVRRRSKRWHRT
jgi:hypothetical protein